MHDSRKPMSKNIKLKSYFSSVVNNVKMWNQSLFRAWDKGEVKTIWQLADVFTRAIEPNNLQVSKMRDNYKLMGIIGR